MLDSKKPVKRICLLFLAAFIALMTAACQNGQSKVDYGDTAHWLALPTAIDKPVDVFYVSPTTWLKITPDEPRFCKIDDPVMIEGAKMLFVEQASAFQPIGNIYAPYYEQLDLYPADREKLVATIPTADITAAFDYYIKHYNNGRPFILAGHSQGSNVLANLLSGYLAEHPDVYKRMIAAYIIGYPVTDAYLAQNPHLKFAQGPDDTGVIISYNTQSPEAEEPNPFAESGARVINPISWATDEVLATAEQNLGSMILDQDKKPIPVQNYADARVDKARGVLICSTVDAEKLSPGNAFLGKGVYHTYNYSLYYFNLRENAANRTRLFLRDDYEKAYDIGLQAYTYGLPLLIANKTFLSMTSVGNSQGAYGPVNQFNHVRTLNDADSKAVVAPGTSGLSSIAWLDLTDEPQVLHIPEVADHHYVLALLDPYTENIKNLGSAHDTPPGDYVLCGPGQHDLNLPPGTKQINVDYTRIWIIGSTQIKGTEDIPNVNRIQDGFTLTSLGKYITSYKPPVVVNPDTIIDAFDMPTGLSYFDTLCQLLQQFPPPAADKPILETFASIGIGPGKIPSKDPQLSDEILRGLRDAAAAGPAQIVADTKSVYEASAQKHNGYFLGGFGAYGTNYKLRAVIATMGLGAFTSDQTIFALTRFDQSMQPLNGSSHYIMHMTELPPAKEGWSITVYDTNGMLISNPIKRYQFNEASSLTRNADGSVDIYFQSDPPQTVMKAGNWLPVKKDQGFQVIIRLIAPEQDSIRGILEGSGWQPPGLVSE